MEGSDCPDGAKEQFVSKEAAEERARYQRYRGFKVHSYRCPACGSWHYGHARRSDKRARLDPHRRR